MFRDWYKKANDDIKPDAELLARILARKPRKRMNNRRLYSLGAAAAGICIVSAAVLSYPVLRDLNQEQSRPQPVPAEWTAAETSSPEQTALPAVTGAPAETVRPAEPAATVKAGGKDDQVPAPAQRTAKPKATPRPENTQTPAEKPKTQDSTPAPAQTQAPGPAASAQPEAPDSGQQTAEGIPDRPAVKGVTSDQVDLVSEVWTKADYAGYLGVDTEAKIQAPADLENITPDARNMSVYMNTKQPYYDVWAYKYKSADGTRALTVKTTKTQRNLPAGGGEEIAIGDAAAMVSKTETGTEVVFHKDGIWYMVKAEGLLEEEWMETCRSILG